MLTRVLRTVRIGTIDRRSQVGVYMRRIREDLVGKLGGDSTPAERLVIDEMAKKAAIVQAAGTTCSPGTRPSARTAACCASCSNTTSSRRATASLAHVLTTLASSGG
jgi:hypothetical protein